MKRWIRRALMALLVSTLLVGALSPAASALVFGSLDRYNGRALNLWEDSSGFMLKGKRVRLVMTEQAANVTRRLTLASIVSQKPSVAGVTPQGWVKAVRPGSTQVILTAEDGRVYTLDLTVVKSNVPTGLWFDVRSLRVYVGEKTRLGERLHAKPIDGLLAKNRIYWSSDNPRVATVNNLGVVTPRKAGNVKITARCGNRKASIRLKIVR